MPPIVYKGVDMIARINSKNVVEPYSTKETAAGEFIELRIDGTKLDYGGCVEEDDCPDDPIIVGKVPGPTGYNDVWATVQTETRNMNAQLRAKYYAVGVAHNNTETLAYYSFDGTSNYTLKMYPSIESISHTTGYAEGGQVLTIDGVSLDGDEVTILVDGVPCIPQTIEKEQITCITGKKEIAELVTDTTATDSTSDPDSDPATTTTPEPSYYVGQQGLKRYSFNSSDVSKETWMANIGTDVENSRMLWTAPEISGTNYFENII